MKKIIAKKSTAKDITKADGKIMQYDVARDRV